LMSIGSKRWMVITLLSVCLCGEVSAQSGRVQTDAKRSSGNAEITKFFIEDAKKDSKYETGPLHIVYSDGTEIVEKLPPLVASTENETVFNDVGFAHLQLAPDRQTLGWEVDVENCCTSYPVPLRVVIFRHGKVFRSIVPGQMVWEWMFLLGGKRLAVVSGATHGPEVGVYRLYDVRTGKLLSEVIGDESTQSLKSDAPAWALQLQESLHGK
jgi:hypothetical protein